MRSLQLTRPATRWISIAMLASASLLMLLDRVRVLREFSFKYTDQDQALLWYQAVEAAHGRFHEPCFFGQAYNPAIEAWCAAPLVRAGISPYIALPAITALLAVTPYFVIAWFSFAAGSPWAAVAVLFVPLALPIEYSIVTSMSRGFVTGLFFAAPAAVLWMNDASTGKGLRFLGAGFLAVLAMTANSNAAILLLFAGVFACLTHWRNPAFWLTSVAGGLIAAPVPLFIHYFYQIHPNYVLHETPSLHFRISNVLEGMRNLNLYFGHFGIWKETGWSVIATFVLIVILLSLLGQGKAAIATGVGLLFTLLTLGLDKVHEVGVLQDLFFPGSRMYLSLPLMAAICFVYLDRGLTQFHWLTARIRLTCRTLCIIAMCALAISRDTTLLRDGQSAMQDGPMYPNSIEHLKQVADTIALLAKSEGIDLLLIINYSCATLNYAAPILTDGAYETVLPQYERRTWRLQEEAVRIRKVILVYIGSSWRLDDTVKLTRNGTTQILSPPVVRVQSADESALETTRRLGAPVRPY